MANEIEKRNGAFLIYQDENRIALVLSTTLGLGL